MIHRKASLILILSVLFFAGCKPKPVDEDKFIRIYTDIVIMSDTTGNTTEQVKKDVFARYNISEKQYENTLKFYNEDPKKWEVFFDKAIAYLESQKKKY